MAADNVHYFSADSVLLLQNILFKIKGKMTQEILIKSDICVRCYHTREFHSTDKGGYDCINRCKFYTFVGQTIEVFEC